MPSDKTISLTHRYRRQIKDLLDRYTMATGHLPEVPAEALEDLIRHLGWRVEDSRVPSDHWGYCDRVNRVIRVAHDLEQRLEYPGAATKVRNATLAHEFAHAILHHRGHPRPWWEREADVWASCFLCPWWLVQARPELSALRRNVLAQTERRSRVRQMGEYFQVTYSFMLSALVSYGVMERLEGGGIQAPVLLCSYARPLWRR